jgi:anhydro-N-acetylmuramic acid kinase
MACLRCPWSCAGQTVFHDPPFSTMQLGDANTIAVTTGMTTVGDFRVADVAAGGNGAPLTSTIDCVLMAPDNIPIVTAATDAAVPADAWRAVQNIGAFSATVVVVTCQSLPCMLCLLTPCRGVALLGVGSGGIGNVTFVPPRAASGCTPLAFDTGPGNVLIDLAVASARAASASTATASGEHCFDKDGAIAASGTVCQPLLSIMMEHPYLQLPPPKTTGREVRRRMSVLRLLLCAVSASPHRWLPPLMLPAVHTGAV